MILGVKRLKELTEKEKLVENLCERERVNPEGAGYDLRMGEVFELKGEGFLGIEERDTPDIKSVAKFDKNEPEEGFVFEPGKYYLMKTVEKLNLPIDLTANIFSRGTLFRCGVKLYIGIVHGGYQGELTFGICNHAANNVKISLGARVAHIIFQEVRGEANHYRGQWQGGRVTTNGKEKQI
ncbi:MAG: 2'-deoxycytidine 5'-triphosphate deaminase [Patescibacteria group bacterium]|nr:2'-deoxycytidine 5'-triphosphate deaminase [Patescibacteria group bacterium]